MQDKIDTTILKIIPELCIAVIANKFVPQFVCWMLLRHADSLLNNGSGYIYKSISIKYLTERINLGPRRVRQIINDGENVFWRFGNNNRLYLESVLKLLDKFNIKNLYSYYIPVPYGVIANTIKQTRSLISAIAVCAFRKPTAMAYMAQVCNINKRTLQRHLAVSADVLVIQRHSLEIERSYDYIYILKIYKKLKSEKKYPEGSLNIRILSNNMYAIIKDMPNTYRFTSGHCSYRKLKYHLKRYRNERNEAI